MHVPQDSMCRKILKIFWFSKSIRICQGRLLWTLVLRIGGGGGGQQPRLLHPIGGRGQSSDSVRLGIGRCALRYGQAGRAGPESKLWDILTGTTDSVYGLARPGPPRVSASPAAGSDDP